MDLAEAMRCLDDREWIVIRGYFWYDLTLKEIGDPLGLTRERIRQIKEQALDKLREALA